MLQFALKDVNQLSKDDRIRLRAFETVRTLQLQSRDGLVKKEDIRRKFHFEGEEIGLIHGQQGIYKPPQMDFLLSIITEIKEHPSAIRYRDQREAHDLVFSSDSSISYMFTRRDPDFIQNQYLRLAREHEIPIIYFLGVAPRLYLVQMPAYIVGWNRQVMEARVAFDIPGKNEIAGPPSQIEARHAHVLAKRRLHQSLFREQLLGVYQKQCVLSGLREIQLLDAAHIVPDRDEELGQPVIGNGLLLAKTHHAAFDANLFGIDPNYRVHVSERLRYQRDGPMLELLKEMHGRRIQLPKERKNYPDQDRLGRRFEEYKTNSA